MHTCHSRCSVVQTYCLACISYAAYVINWMIIHIHAQRSVPANDPQLPDVRVSQAGLDVQACSDASLIQTSSLEPSGLHPSSLEPQ